MVLVSILVFSVLRLLPGDPALARVGSARNVSPQAIAHLRHVYGLDRSIARQYVIWVTHLLHGDLGRSFLSDYPVSRLLAQGLGPTVELALSGLLLGVVLALVVAVAPVLWPKRLISQIVSSYTTLGMAAPPFVYGIILIAVFSVWLRVLPNVGYVSFANHPLQSLKYVAMPAVTLGIAVSAPLVRYLRASLQEALMAPYVRTAQGKGLSHRRVVLVHALPNALLPSLTVLGVMVGSLLGGVVVVEYVFRWPGLGSIIVNAVVQRDYSLLQAAVLLAAAAFIGVNLLVDLSYGLLDPRLRIGRGIQK